jgi:putative transposase
MRNPFRYFKTSPEIIRLTVMLYVRFPLSLRQVEDLLHERGIDISYETVRAWWNRFGPLFASEIKKQRLAAMHGFTQWRWQNSGVQSRYRNSLRCMLQFTTTSINNAISTAARNSKTIAPTPSRSGVNLLPDAGRAAT